MQFVPRSHDVRLLRGEGLAQCRTQVRRNAGSTAAVEHSSESSARIEIRAAFCTRRLVRKYSAVFFRKLWFPAQESRCHIGEHISDMGSASFSAHSSPRARTPMDDAYVLVRVVVFKAQAFIA